MVYTKKINKDAVAVVCNHIHCDEALIKILMRKSGKEYANATEGMVYVCENKLVINKPVAEKYGLQVVVRGE